MLTGGEGVGLWYVRHCNALIFLILIFGLGACRKRSVTGATGPTVLSVTTDSADGLYKIGGSITIKITFSDAVTVTGTPQLSLETGYTDAIANYSAMDGTDTLTFTYTVANGEAASDLDYASTESLSLNSGTIKDAKGNAAVLTLPSPGANGSLAASADLEVDAAVQVVNGYSSTCWRSGSGSVKCWGDNAFGGLGQGHTNTIGDGANEMGNNLSAISMGTGRTVKQIDPGTYHTCAVLDNGSAKCWGRNNLGQLGQGNTNGLGDGANEMGDNLLAIDLGTSLLATQIITGTSHSCAVLDDATVKCWGENNNGQLGLGHVNTLGDGANEMGSNLTAVALGTGRTAAHVVAGDTHTCALLDNGTVKCWGNNGSGRLGQGHTNTLGDGANEMGDNLSAVSLGSGRTATQISVGSAHSCALLDDGTVKCWGGNSFGQLGQGHTNSLGDGANEMGNNLSAVDLGTGRTARQITAGEDYTCALLDNWTVKCWGDNNYGQLGQGHSSRIGDGANEMGDNLSAIDLGTSRFAIFLGTGYAHTCAVLDDLTLKCWGRNGSGQLGLGHTNSLGDGANEMGNSLSTVSLGSRVKDLLSLDHPPAQISYNGR